MGAEKGQRSVLVVFFVGVFEFRVYKTMSIDSDLVAHVLSRDSLRTNRVYYLRQVSTEAFRLPSEM